MRLRGPDLQEEEEGADVHKVLHYILFFYKLRIKWIGKNKETKQIRKYCNILYCSFRSIFNVNL